MSLIAWFDKLTYSVKITLIESKSKKYKKNHRLKKWLSFYDWVLHTHTHTRVVSVDALDKVNVKEICKTFTGEKKSVRQ